MPSLLVHSISALYTMDPSMDPTTGSPLGLLHDAAVGFRDGKVCYIGPSSSAPAPTAGTQLIDGSGCVATPGLVDAHTHTVWAGSRADEFARRLAGADYTQILERGGGILSTVRATRAASLEQLTVLARARVLSMRARGVTTIEIKSGYGLEPQTERRSLQAARACADIVRVSTTFLGAHTVPAEYRGQREAYVDQIINVQLPHVADLADAIDVYCDRGAFTLEESVRILSAGKALGLSVKAHAEQVSCTGIAAAAAALGATSVDHLEQLDAAGISALARHGTVAVLLPGAQLYLRDDPPPVQALRAAGVPMAVASDLNPGSSPVHDLWSCATLACLLQGLTMEEVLLGITRNAGRALGRADLGWLGTESVADLALFRPAPGEPAQMQSLIQHMGGHHTVAVIQDGIQTL